MAYDPNSGGWSMGPMGGQTQPSTSQAPFSPQQVAQIQAQTQQMMQPTTPANPQQQNMMSGLMGPQSQLGPNLGAAGTALWGSSPAYGGGNILSGDAYGGSAANPLPGMTQADYG